MSAKVATRFVALCLFVIFVSRITISLLKLQDRQIGTSTTRKNSRYVDYPAMTFCTASNA